MQRLMIYSQKFLAVIVFFTFFARPVLSTSVFDMSLGDRIRESQFILLAHCIKVEGEKYSIEFSYFPGISYAGFRYGRYNIVEALKGKYSKKTIKIDYKLAYHNYNSSITELAPSDSARELEFQPKQYELVALFLDKDKNIKFGPEGKIVLHEKEIPLFRDAVASALELDNIDQDDRFNIIVSNLKSDNRYISHSAWIEFLNLDPEKYGLRITELLNSEDESTVRLALTVLSGTTDSLIMNFILPFLNDQNPQYRKLAVRALGGIPDERTIRTLIECYEDPDPAVRGYAISELYHQYHAAGAIPSYESGNVLPLPIGHHEGSDPHALKDSILVLYRRYADQTSKYRDEVVSLFYDAAGDTNSWVRRNGLKALGIVKEKQSEEILLKALDDDKASIRKAAADVLCSWNNPTLVNTLGELFCRDTSYVRLPILGSLKFYADSGYMNISDQLYIVECLREIVFNQKIYAIRGSVLNILGKLDDPVIMNSLPELLFDRDDGVRKVTIRIISNTGDAKYLPLLKKALKTETDENAIGKLERAIKMLSD
jgi:HEAT repeat protein